MEKANVGFNGYLSNGLKVFYTFPLDTLADMVALAGHLGNVIALTDVMISQGFALTDPAYGKLEAGEHRESVNAVLRRKFMEDDGTIVPVIDIYPDNPALGRRCVFYYLNDDKQIAEFETATGLKLTELPVFDDAQLNRVEKPELAKKFLRAIKVTASVVFKDNPAYDANAAKKKAKHIFVRWESANSQPSPTPQPQPSQPATPPAVNHAEPDYAALELAERKKAVTALDNEAVTLFKAHYNAQHNGQGNPRWDGTVRTADNATVPIVIWTEHVNLLKQAGYELPRDSDDLAIPVITGMVGGERQIKGVEAIDGTWMYLSDKKPANANVDGNQANSDTPSWIFDRAKLLYQLSKRCPKVTAQERAATADKMFRDNEFDKVGSLEGAVAMVVSRLATHKKEKVPA